MNEARALLNGGISFLNSEAKEDLKAYEVLMLPRGTKLLIIKDKELKLENPLIHIESELRDDKYSYQREKAILTTNTKVDSYQILIQDTKNNQYYTIERVYKYNENTLYHYYLNQVDIAHLLIFDSVDDIPESITWDFNSIPQMLELFQSNKINIYPKELLTTESFLIDKGIFLDLLDSYTISKAYKHTIQRTDLLRFYLNNYTQEDIFLLLQKIQEFIDDGLLQIINTFSYADIKTIKESGLYSSVGFYFDMQIAYTLEQQSPAPIKQYIKEVIFNLNLRRHSSV